MTTGNKRRHPNGLRYPDKPSDKAWCVVTIPESDTATVSFHKHGKDAYAEAIMILERTTEYVTVFVMRTESVGNN